MRNDCNPLGVLFANRIDSKNDFCPRAPESISIHTEAKLYRGITLSKPRERKRCRRSKRQNAINRRRNVMSRPVDQWRRSVVRPERSSIRDFLLRKKIEAVVAIWRPRRLEKAFLNSDAERWRKGSKTIRVDYSPQMTHSHLSSWCLDGGWSSLDLLAVRVEPHIPQSDTVHHFLRNFELTIAPKDGLHKFDSRIFAH